MNPQQSSIKQSALGWVKKSIDDYLVEIKTNLKLYIEEDDTELLELVKDRLDLIQGVLTMIEQYGAAMLTEEMLSLSQYVIDKQEEKTDQALEVLLRAVLQLPDYLEHIQSGYKDIPIAILPLLNDIRAVKNQDLFSEKLLFLPDLSMHQQAAETESIDAAQNQASQLLTKKLRPIYQLALVNVIRDRAVEENLKRIEKICETLEERSNSEQIARIWWIVGALVESVRRQQLELGVSIKNLLGKVDALFRVILIIGEKGLLKRQPIDLIKNFLYYIAQPECDGPKTQAIKTAYRLEQFLPSEATRSKVLDNIAGPNQALLKTVAEAVKADIESVKTTLEVYVNGDLSNIDLLKDIPHEMHVISDTLAMIGLGLQRQLIESQISTVKQIISGETPADEEKLLSMAGELLQVEQALEVMQKRVPAPEGEERNETEASRDYEFDNVLSAVVTAALDNIQKTKSAILEFVKDTSRRENIELCIAMMEEAQGALVLLNQHHGGEIVEGLVRYLQQNDPVAFMQDDRLDLLSQVIVSLEYYLEALGEHRNDAGAILDMAGSQLNELLIISNLGDDLADEVSDDADVEADSESKDVDVEDTVAPDFGTNADDKAASDELETPLLDQVELTAEGVQVEPDIESDAEIEDLNPKADFADGLAAIDTEEDANAFNPGGEHSAETQELSDQMVSSDEDVDEDKAAIESIYESILKEEVADTLNEPSLIEESEDPVESVDDISFGEIELMDEPVLDHEPAINEDPEIIDALEVDRNEEIIEDISVNQLSDDLQDIHSALEIESTEIIPPEFTESIAAEDPFIPQEDDKPTETDIDDSNEESEISNGSGFTVIPVVEDLEVLQPDSDQEILEIYLEEAEEEAVNIGRLQKDWMLHPEDENAIKNIRRAFHTIKGSGRLVGASKIGEFSWDYEQLLNRVIDKTVITTPELIDAVGLASVTLFELVEELKTEKPPVSDIPYQRGLARALAEFNAEKVLSEHTLIMQRPESDNDKITDEPYDPGNLVDIDDDPLESDVDLSMSVEPDTMIVPASMFDQEAEPQVDVDDVAEMSADVEVEETSLDQPAEIDLQDIEANHQEISDEISIQGQNDIHVPEIDVNESTVDEEQIVVSSDDVESDSIITAMAHEAELLNDPERIEIDDSAGLEDEDFVDLEASIIMERPDFSHGFEDQEESDEIYEISPDDISYEIFDEIPSVEGLEVNESDSHLTEEKVMSESPLHSVSDQEDNLSSSLELENTATASIQPDQARGDPPDPFADMTGNVKDGEKTEVRNPNDLEQNEATSLSFDPELLTIYQQEVDQHLSIVNSALKRSEASGELVPGEEIYRALHTIHGASRTADIGSIGELSGLMEKPLKAALAQTMALDMEIVTLYRQGYHALKDMTSELVKTRQLPIINQDLKTSFQALADDLEEHTVEIPDDSEQPTGVFVDTLTMMNDAASVMEQDDELLTIFIDEANELLEMSDQTLHDWSDQAADDSGNFDFTAVMELQRYLHTLKGGARMAELKEISDLSHEMESLFIAVIDNRVEKNEDLMDLLKDSFDLLHQQVEEAQSGTGLSDPSAQVKLIKAMRRGGNADQSEVVAEASIEIDSEDIDIVAENLTGESTSQSDRQTQDVIRVRSDLLDNLVNSAGEVSIYRARMEQQVAGLGSYLGELGQTITRLKTQLRNLEAETDAQIHFSHKTQAKDSDEFDPLEMDRYTLIQELSRSLGESVNDLSSLQTMLGDQVKDSETLLLQQSRVNTDLQDGLIKSRMVRFSGLLSRMRRLVRQSSQEVAKKAELVVTGEDNEVDNKVLDRMVAPLEHIIRNAISHGIETPVERVKKGKPEIGVISIDIHRDGSDIVIKVSDDGSGVNIDKIRSRAIQLGLIEENHSLSDSDLIQFILEPGFSTAEHVTQLSGRGVGMDVVDIEIKQLGGTLQIETNPQGTSFIARLPFTLSINQAILVRTGEETYAIPLINIEGITRLDSTELVSYYQQENPQLEYGGQQFTLHNLSKLVEASDHFKPDEENKQAVILGRAGDIRVALHVDEILGNREIVVKSLGKQLSQVKSLAGASILADGSVVLILDINGIIRHSVSSTVKIVYSDEVESSQVKLKNTVMVVDDSITMRRVASKLLERHNYQVVTAKDGVDALAQLEDVQPDVMLLDVEMPRMDGFELATHMQNEASYSDIPIIMITSRTGEKHRDRALEIGVSNYMGKPYQEDELINNIQKALAINPKGL